MSFVGAVGTDEFGPMLAATLATQGVSIDRLGRVPGPSGIAVITVDDNAENSIVVVPGANGQVRLAEADAALIREAAMLLLQLEIPLPTVLAGATAATEAGVPVLLNPSPVVSPTARIALPGHDSRAQPGRGRRAG